MARVVSSLRCATVAVGVADGPAALPLPLTTATPPPPLLPLPLLGGAGTLVVVRVIVVVVAVSTIFTKQQIFSVAFFQIFTVFRFSTMQAARALAKRYRTKLNLRAQLTAASLLVLFLQRELGDLLLSISISLALSLSANLRVILVSGNCRHYCCCGCCCCCSSTSPNGSS